MCDVRTRRIEGDMARYRYEVEMMTDCGNVRPYNQDSLLCRKGSLNGDDFFLLAVADGMGGMERGELASSEIMNVLDGWWKNSLKIVLENGVQIEEVSSSLSYAIEAGNRRIRELAETEGIHTGTTLSLIFLYKEQYLMKHIGDSRIYCLREHAAYQISEDHTWCQQEVEKGNLSREEAEHHTMKHVLTNAIGGRESLRIDTKVGEFRKKDRIVLCTDGFYNYVSNKEIVKLLGGKEKPKRKLQKAFMAVKETTASDNISVILIQRKRQWLWG
ncbi:MAG: protein phosphatase 2C domain-containing protein [bacterium]|nr:protein phosphatase 2C domain-containing protein [bacterium]